MMTVVACSHGGLRWHLRIPEAAETCSRAGVPSREGDIMIVVALIRGAVREYEGI
jgi:hypothetical protein